MARYSHASFVYFLYNTKEEDGEMKFLSFHFVVKMVLRTSFRKYQSNKFCCLKFCINESSFDNFIFPSRFFKYNDCEKTKKGNSTRFSEKEMTSYIPIYNACISFLLFVSVEKSGKRFIDQLKFNRQIAQPRAENSTVRKITEMRRMREKASDWVFRPEFDQGQTLRDYKERSRFASPSLVC